MKVDLPSVTKHRGDPCARPMIPGGADREDGSPKCVVPPTIDRWTETWLSRSAAAKTIEPQEEADATSPPIAFIASFSGERPHLDGRWRWQAPPRVRHGIGESRDRFSPLRSGGDLEVAGRPGEERRSAG